MSAALQRAVANYVAAWIKAVNACTDLSTIVGLLLDAAKLFLPKVDWDCPKGSSYERPDIIDAGLKDSRGLLTDLIRASRASLVDARDVFSTTSFFLFADTLLSGDPATSADG
jgi:hypothetical protein